MKKTIFILSSLFLTVIMQAQDRPQPKPGPAPVINIGKPQTFELKNGLKVLVVENSKLPRVSFNLTLDNVPYAEGDKKGVADLTSALIGSGTKKMSKDVFNEEIDFLGANIGFNSEGAYASGLSKYADRILELMADGALNSVFTQEEFDKEKAKLIEGLKTSEKSVQAVASRVENVLVYGKNHPSGEFLSEEVINKVTLNDAVQNYNSYFVPANAYLVVIGDVKFKEVKKAVEKYFGSWKKATAPAVSYADPKDVQYTQINFVDMPNAVQSEISLVNVSTLKMTDKDYFAAVLANQIIGGDFNSYLNMNLREAHGWTYGARSSIRGDKYVGKFKSSTQVRNSVTDSAVVEFFKELKKIRTEKVTSEMLKNVKAGYVGNFVMQIQKPGTVARYALLTQTQGLPADFYENYIKNINAVTAEDIQTVANKYFLADNTRVMITGKGSEVLPALEKLGIPMFYFDKFGNSIEKPVTKKELPAGVTAKSVFENYIKAVGGEKAVATVKTVASKGTATIPGAPAPITYISKLDAKGKYLVEALMGPMSVMKQAYNGKTGYMTQQGQKTNLEGDMLADVKASAHPFPELGLKNATDTQLKGIESIDGVDAYAIVNGKTTRYYDVKTGLKISEVTSSPQGNSGVAYKNYKDVKGLKFPFSLVLDMGMSVEVKIDEVKVNEGVTEADFN